MDENVQYHISVCYDNGIGGPRVVDYYGLLAAAVGDNGTLKVSQYESIDDAVKGDPSMERVWNKDAWADFKVTRWIVTGE